MIFAGQFEEEHMIAGSLQLQGRGLPLRPLPPLLTQLRPAFALPNARPKPSSLPAACAPSRKSWVQFILMSQSFGKDAGLQAPVLAWVPNIVQHIWSGDVRYIF